MIFVGFCILLGSDQVAIMVYRIVPCAVLTPHTREKLAGAAGVMSA